MEEKNKMSIIVENKDWKLFKNANGTYDLRHTMEDIELKGLTKAHITALQSILDGVAKSV